MLYYVGHILALPLSNPIALVLLPLFCFEIENFAPGVLGVDPPKRRCAADLAEVMRLSAWGNLCEVSHCRSLHFGGRLRRFYRVSIREVRRILLVSVSWASELLTFVS